MSWQLNMDTLKKSKIDFNDPILKDITILYLDEDELLLNEISAIFKGFFKEIITTSNPQEGIELYNKRKNDIDLILTDISIPEYGINFIRQIRENEIEIPILIITEDNNSENLIEAIRLKVTDYILKPIQLSETLNIIYRTITTKQNILLLKKNQRELQQYKDVFEHDYLIIEINLKKEITHVNELFCKISGYQEEELLGLPNSKIRHPDTTDSVRNGLWDTINEGEIWRGKLKNVAKDGSVFIVKYSVIPIFNSNGKIEKFIGTGVLITSEEQEKQTLKRFIIKQKSEKIKSEQEYQIRIDKEIEKAINETKLKSKNDQKDILFVLNELKDEIKRLREKNLEYTQHIVTAEKMIKESNNKIKAMKLSYASKKENLNNHMQRVVGIQEEYQLIKEKNSALKEELNRCDIVIRTQEEDIDNYNRRITQLQNELDKYKKK